MTTPPDAQGPVCRRCGVPMIHIAITLDGSDFYRVDVLIAQAVQAERDERLTYPDDPACSVAAMLSRMSPEDKQAFNFCVKTAVAQAEPNSASASGS